MSTPRPSISPLSNAFESIKGSPSAVRSMNLAEAGDGRDRMAFDEDEDKDDSSVLSEPEDDDDDNEEQHLAAVSRNQTLLTKDDIDSEAETERLELTPRHARNLADGIVGRTPSKLSKVAQHDDELSDPPTPIPNDTGAASSTSTANTAGKKRKRSDELDSPLSSEASIDGESPRKRTGSFKTERSSGHDRRDEVLENAEDEDGSRAPKGRKSIGKRVGRLAREESEPRDTADPEEEVAEMDAVETVEAQPEEDPVQKSEATNAFSELAKQFTAFRDALYSERIASIEQELQLLEQAECQHPEYVRMVACVQQRRLKQDRETRAFHQYRQVATKEKILAERAQLHSQYFQTVREVREEALDELGSAWYSIQRERRQGVSAAATDDYQHVYRYVDKRTDLLRQQAKYNREVSILAGVAKYVGFPAAPDINGIEGEGLDEDLRAMRLARPTQHHSQPVQQRHSYMSHAGPQSYMQRQAEATAASAERLAQERFAEQHAWARAPTSANHTPFVTTPNISHTPEWADHTSGFRKAAQKHGPSQGTTPSATPLNEGRRPPPPDVPDSAELDRKDFVPAGSSPLQVPKQRLNGAESNGWRNYSGTSTIDAPLGDGSKEYDGHEGEQTTARDFAHDHGATQAELTRPPVPTPLFASDKTESFRAAGFRPLDGSYAPAASNSVGSS